METEARYDGWQLKAMARLLSADSMRFQSTLRLQSWPVRAYKKVGTPSMDHKWCSTSRRPRAFTCTSVMLGFSSVGQRGLISTETYENIAFSNGFGRHPKQDFFSSNLKQFIQIMSKEVQKPNRIGKNCNIE